MILNLQKSKQVSDPRDAHALALVLTENMLQRCTVAAEGLIRTLRPAHHLSPPL